MILFVALSGPSNSSAGAPSLEPEKTDLRGSSLIVTKGINGGSAPAFPRRRTVLAYDWNAQAFRVADWCIGNPGVTRVARIPAARFRELLDHVHALGLASLPVEEPRRIEDIYGLDVGIEFLHRGAFWRNSAPGGCNRSPSAIQPDAADRECFDAVLAYVQQTLESLPMEPGTSLDLQAVPMTSEGEAASYQLAIEHLRGEPFADEVDFNRVRPEGFVFRFAWRESQHPLFQGRLRDWPGYVDVAVNEAGTRTQRIQRPDGDLAEARTRRRAFIDEHPELSPLDRELILLGWVQAGMSEEMVIAAWGPPHGRNVSEWGTVYLRYDRPAAPSLPFEAGRLRFDPWLPQRPLSRPRRAP